MPLLSTLGGGSVFGFKLPAGDAGPPEFSTAADTVVAEIFADDIYPTTINDSNKRDFWCWSTRQFGTGGGKGSCNYFMFSSKSDTSKGWRSAYASGVSSWYIDLGHTRSVERLQWYMFDGQSALTQIRWYGSTDFSSWTQLFDAPNPGSANNTDYDTGVQSSWNYRYLQFRINHTSNNYGTWNNLTITLGAVTQLNTTAVTAVDPDSGPVTYAVSAGSLPNGIQLNATTGKLVPDGNKVDKTGYQANGVVTDFTVRATDETGNIAERQFKVKRSWRDGSTSDKAIHHPGAGVLGLHNQTAGLFASGTKYMQTNNGGIQQCYVLNDGKGDGWVQLARYKRDASLEVRGAASSVRGLSDISENNANKWSCDFGGAEADAVMVWGSANFSDQTVSSNTKVNWVYKIARGDSTQSHGTTGDANRNTLFHWIWNQDGNTGGMMNSSSRTAFGLVDQHGYNLGGKCGHLCLGASDGPFKNNRWNNTAYRGHRFSDNSNTPGGEPYHIFEPNGDMMGMNVADDAKWSVSATNSNGGQDTDSSQLFGWDDGNGPGFYDVGTGNEGQNSTRHDFNGSGNGPAVTMWWTQGYTRMQ
tara:strand:+ start:714 stop:2471 length:1758 start_codon:yes stop_codon:yes gene_type:complete